VSLWQLGRSASVTSEHPQAKTSSVGPPTEKKILLCAIFCITVHQASSKSNQARFKIGGVAINSNNILGFIMKKCVVHNRPTIG
jgi:hypothetical protein